MYFKCAVIHILPRHRQHNRRRAYYGGATLRDGLNLLVDLYVLDQQSVLF